MKVEATQIENLKLWSIPVALLLMSYLGFLAVKSNYINESEVGAQIQKNTRERIPSSVKVQKPHGAIEVEILKDGASPFVKGQATELVGVVTAEREVSNVEVQWHFPKEIERTDGEQSLTLNTLKAGEARKVSIKVISHSENNEQIHLEASYLQGDLKIGSTSQFNTVDQKRLNAKNSSHEEGRKIWQ